MTGADRTGIIFLWVNGSKDSFGGGGAVRRVFHGPEGPVGLDHGAGGMSGTVSVMVPFGRER